MKENNKSKLTETLEPILLQTKKNSDAFQMLKK
jgi:hypothetical protein